MPVRPAAYGFADCVSQSKTVVYTVAIPGDEDACAPSSDKQRADKIVSNPSRAAWSKNGKPAFLTPEKQGMNVVDARCIGGLGSGIQGLCGIAMGAASVRSGAP